MAVGPLVRQLFGRHEPAVAALYRSLFIDIDALADQVAQWAPDCRTILEVGCGEGAVTEQLVKRFPHARIVAIDITPRVGRLYRGDPARVQFSQRTVQEVAAEHPGAFDLVLLCDVVHHVPDALRDGIFAAIGTALAPGGRFFFKDWGRSRTPIHWLCHAGDRWLTGDRVRYLDVSEGEALARRGLPGARIVDAAWVRPWRNNFAMLIER